MALTDILEKIRREYEDRLKELEKSFEEKKKHAEQEHEKAQKKIDSEMHDRVEEKSAKSLEKANTLADMEAKNQLLLAKRRVIGETLDKAIQKLAKSKDYAAILTELLAQAHLEGDEIVVIPAKGKEDETKKAIKEAGQKYYISEKSADISGGIILKTEKVEIDSSFESIVKSQLKDKLEITINNLLFS